MTDAEFKAAMDRNWRWFRLAMAAVWVVYFAWLGWVVWRFT